MKIHRAAWLSTLVVLGGCSLYFGNSSGPPASDNGEKRVFVTSSVYPGGELDGMAGADAICAQHATNAGLPGTYLAWLSAGTESPATRMAHSTGVYTLVGGGVVSWGWNNLVSGGLAGAIDHDENGAVHNASPTCMEAVAVWSATNFDGTALPNPNIDGEITCYGWTSSVGDGSLGDVNQTDTAWTDYGCSVPCTESAALYCIEQ